MSSYIIKPSRHCNLRCTYCHDWREFGTSKEIELSTIIELTRKAFDDDKHVQFIWHGGEPLLLGKEFFKKILWVQNELATDEHEVSNVLQSNGLLVDDEWCEFFNRYGIHVGLSIDGPQRIHGRSRPKIGGQDSYDNVVRGLKALQRNEVPHGILIVMNRELFEMGAREVFDWTKSLGIKEYSLLPVRPDNRNQNEGKMAKFEYVHDEEYSAFMCELYDYWRAEDDRSISIREIRSIQEVLYTHRATVCVLAGGCAGRYFGVEADGRMYHCDKYVEDEDYYVGNILHSSVQELRKHANLRRTIQENRAVEARYKEHCKWFHVCRGGCPHDRYMREGYKGTSEPETCCGQSPLIAHIAKAELPLADLAEAAFGSTAEVGK